ncbi:hypothetical protein BBF96_05155 [Anoxybacter fermentans]|uniref:Uncharacterized protein n=1 Tax=Anoxybacter fermentans TaxID=1323375 RepID=A0A3Q9HPZ2_9FIRM|nr:hypothetical protein [Anoxybacter fermentans]AZR72830.1 hypothetical protein BBF96_05155 [Anoxybacter fermentans]
MKDKPKIIRKKLEEDFAKKYPTRDPNPEDLLYLQGYEGEVYRELVANEMDSTRDDENNFFPFKGGKGDI